MFYTVENRMPLVITITETTRDKPNGSYVHGALIIAGVLGRFQVAGRSF